MGLFLATGRARRLSALAAGKQLCRSGWLWLAAGSGSGLTVWDFSPEMSAFLLSSVGLLLGRKEVLVRRGGEDLSLVSPPILSFLVAVLSSSTLELVPALSEVVLSLLTGLLTMGTILSGMALSGLGADHCLISETQLGSPHCFLSGKNRSGGRQGERRQDGKGGRRKASADSQESSETEKGGGRRMALFLVQSAPVTL